VNEKSVALEGSDELPLKVRSFAEGLNQRKRIHIDL
jgi:hypothetical protein